MRRPLREPVDLQKRHELIDSLARTAQILREMSAHTFTRVDPRSVKELLERLDFFRMGLNTSDGSIFLNPEVALSRRVIAVMKEGLTEESAAKATRLLLPETDTVKFVVLSRLKAATDVNDTAAYEFIYALEDAVFQKH